MMALLERLVENQNGKNETNKEIENVEGIGALVGRLQVVAAWETFKASA